MKALAVAMSLLLLAAVAGADVIYTENFDNDSGTNQALTYVGWAGMIKTGADTTLGELKVQTNYGGLIVAFAAAGTNNKLPALAYTNEQAIDRSVWENISVSWLGGNGNHVNTDGLQSLALKIGDSWYVETTGRNLAGGTAVENDLTQATVAIDSASWSVFSVDNPISRGAATTLPAGNIVAFGILFEDLTGGTGGAGGQQLDNFVISGALTPEPASLSILLTGGIALFARKRRNR